MFSRGLDGRCELVAGNFFESVPAGCDAYILKDILHDWDDERATEILKVCRRAAQPKVTLLVMEMLIEDGTGPHPSKLLDMQMMTATHQGRQRTEREFQALFSAAGFRLVRVVRLASPTSIVVAEAV